MKETDAEIFPRMRRSACAEASLRAEIERLKKMSAEERMNAALKLGKVYGRLLNSYKVEDNDGKR